MTTRTDEETKMASPITAEAPHTATAEPIRFDFHRGHPNPDLLPVAELQTVLKKVASDAAILQSSGCLNYPSCDRGDPALLAELSAFLDRQSQYDDLRSLSQTPATTSSSCADNLFVTHGVSHGLELVCATLTKPGDVVLVEQPTYFLVQGMLQSHSLQIRSIPTVSDVDHRIDMDGLEQTIKQFQPRMMYLIPTHQNPTGRTLSLQERIQIIRLARQYHVLVVADEVYHYLDWSGSIHIIDSKDDQSRQMSDSRIARPARMAVVDRFLDASGATSGGTDGTIVISLNALTKIFCPGVRFGWIECPKGMLSSILDYGYIVSQGGCVPFMGEVIRVALKDRIIDTSLERLCRAYCHRSNSLCNILQQHDSNIGIDTFPVGGYFVWIKLPVPSAIQFLQYCLKRGLKFLSGERCDITQDAVIGGNEHNKVSRCASHARLCFADMDETNIEEGARFLVECLAQYRQDMNQ